jgi:predicted RNA binding protein YcfA (HicA-like mRNA interferase family)
MAKVETNRARIVKRLIAEGWQNVGGGAHDKFVKPGRQSIMVPRHRTVTRAWPGRSPKAPGGFRPTGT